VEGLLLFYEQHSIEKIANLKLSGFTVLFSGEQVLWNETMFMVKIWFWVDHNAPVRTAHDLSRVWIQKNNNRTIHTTQGCQKKLRRFDQVSDLKSTLLALC
jgi:hypothetical protein